MPRKEFGSLYALTPDRLSDLIKPVNYRTRGPRKVNRLPPYSQFQTRQLQAAPL